MRLSAAIWPLLAAAVTAYDFTESSEALLPVFVDSTLHHHPLRFDVLRTSSRCVGATHADDLALVQLDVRLQVELDEPPVRLRPLISASRVNAARPVTAARPTPR